MAEFDVSIGNRLQGNLENLVPFYPYGLRAYRQPGSNSNLWDISEYDPEMHQANIVAIENTLSHFAGENDFTPWMTNGVGVLAVAGSEDKFTYSNVYVRDDNMAYRQGVHFVKQEVKVHADKGIKARTLVYPTAQRVVQLLTTSDAAWSMSYPTLNRDPKGASREIQQNLASPHDLEVASTDTINEFFPHRRFALEHWVGVKI